MSTSTTAVTSSKTETFARRKARTLVGWMPEHEGALWIAGRQLAATPDPAHLVICQAARAVVSKRPVGCDQTNIFQQLPSTLDSHIAMLRAHPRSAQVLAEAGEPRLVNIQQVCAAQPTIHVEDAIARVGHLDPGDLVGLAQVTLPLHVPVQLPYMFDHTKNAWILSSPNPNLRIAGPFTAEVQLILSTFR